ncbi:hypothetical protein HY635_01995, partial [Candidatus Uhrbacteria bacterium]|nr:hypothetical protein [Candidatus Uhrbacteria bacterium]
MTHPRERVVQITAATLIVAGLLVLSQIRAAALTYTEDFSTTTHRDTATTARWDTGTGDVRLPSGSASWAALSDLNTLDVTALAVSPSFASDGTAFAGVASGIYRTTDSGSAWALVAKIARPVMRIVVSPSFASDGTAFAVTNGDGLWRTTNSGASWVRISAGASGFGVAISPQYASDRTVFISTFTSIKKSTDGGATWADQQNGIDATVIENGDLRGIAISRSYGSDQTVFATALGFGMYRSTDGGATWATANPSDLAIQYATVVVTGPGGRVAGAFLDEAYSSKDNGTTWAKVYSGDVNDLAYSPDGTLLLATAAGPLRSGSAIASGWPAGAAKSLAVAATYPASGSVLAGRSTGASRTETGFPASAVAISKVVDTTPYRITRATLTPTVELPAGTSITYHLSVKDGAASWEGPATPGSPWTFIAAGSSLRWRATLSTSDTAATPTLTALTIAYEAADTLTAPTSTT